MKLAPCISSEHHLIVLVGTLRFNDADSNENVKKKNNRFNKQNNNLAGGSHLFY